LEGDASLTDRQWLSTYATPQDFQEIQEFYSTFEQPVYDMTPAFLQEDFIFPYEEGVAFVEYLYDEGGWRAVDEAYRSPPVTTEQILHPDRFPSDQPKLVDLPDLIPVLGEGWREISRNTMGEWYTFLTLAHGLDPQARLDPEDASQAAEGWGGDSYTVLHNDQSGETAMLLVTDWDNSRDARQFADAFTEYASNRFGNPSQEGNGITSWESTQDYTLFKLDGERTIWVFAPDKSRAESILNAIPAL
jgi:hypothetical protein